MSALRIRPFRPGDEARVYEVCVRTGDSGDDATALYDDPDLLGHVYAGPYLALMPGFAFMLVDEHDVVVGYVLGAPDTATFERACEEAWWPPLRERYPENPRRADDARMVRHIHRVRPTVVPDGYPAHLHIDLLPVAQGRGHGRALMQRLFDELSAAGAPGVHLGVSEANHRAIGFYTRLGFTTIRRYEGGRLMARSLR